MADNQAKSTPARVLCLFTFLLAGLAAALWRDHQADVRVESVDYPTALGDEQLCPVGLLQVGQTFTAKLDQTDQPMPLIVVSNSALTKREERLWKIGRADAGDFYIYQSDRAEDPAWYVKSAPNEFYRVSQGH